MTENERKKTGTSPAVLPTTVIYDAALVADLPRELAVASGLNALAHCIDSVWAPHANPINLALSLEATRVLVQGLDKLATANSLAAHEQLLYGAYLAAVAFSTAGSAIHHKICHVLGGTFNMPHAQTHAVVLPYVLAFNLDCLEDELAARISEAITGSASADPLQAINDLRRRINAPSSLADYGFTPDDVELAARLAMEAIPASNPRRVSEADLQRLLTSALHGDDPSRVKLGPQ